MLDCDVGFFTHQIFSSRSLRLNEANTDWKRDLHSYSALLNHSILSLDAEECLRMYNIVKIKCRFRRCIPIAPNATIRSKNKNEMKAIIKWMMPNPRSLKWAISVNQFSRVISPSSGCSFSVLRLKIDYQQVSATCRNQDPVQRCPCRNFLGWLSLCLWRSESPFRFGQPYPNS